MRSVFAHVGREVGVGFPAVRLLAVAVLMTYAIKPSITGPVGVVTTDEPDLVRPGWNMVPRPASHNRAATSSPGDEPRRLTQPGGHGVGEEEEEEEEEEKPKETMQDEDSEFDGLSMPGEGATDEDREARAQKLDDALYEKFHGLSMHGDPNYAHDPAEHHQEAQGVVKRSDGTGEQLVAPSDGEQAADEVVYEKFHGLSMHGDPNYVHDPAEHPQEAQGDGAAAAQGEDFVQQAFHGVSMHGDAAYVHDDADKQPPAEVAPSDIKEEAWQALHGEVMHGGDFKDSDDTRRADETADHHKMTEEEFTQYQQEMKRAAERSGEAGGYSRELGGVEGGMREEDKMAERYSKQTNLHRGDDL
ncbi:PREDICTED: uncharacterized protein LOC106813057 [Priapulus caudatus]|uniref:Uncharacterized protein LOC106813057 n=1 Tax=Priapulus caudatus TaxID=37621 RepID=A0ABM1EK67_PRICU|nr:PREDICTED: uncharacterized protein LOC106813057 [Priapulus caudatus]